MVAFIGPDDTAAAVMLMGAAQRLMRHKHGIAIRAFVVTPGAAGEVQAAALRGEAADRQSVVEFAHLPVFELLPDLLARPRLCISFGSEESLPYVLRSMACGVPCVVVTGSVLEPEIRPNGPDWQDFVLKTGDSDSALARGVESVLREPALRARLAREGRRFVIARHSLDAIQREESVLLRQPGLVADVKEAAPGKEESEFDAEAEAAKLAVMVGMVAAMHEEAA
jgi:glycosyltransferase involved in cell wall biosynthesis